MKTKEEFDQIAKDYDDAKSEFIKATDKYLKTFCPLSDEGEEDNLIKILELMP